MDSPDHIYLICTPEGAGRMRRLLVDYPEVVHLVHILVPRRLKLSADILRYEPLDYIEEFLKEFPSNVRLGRCKRIITKLKHKDFPK